MLGPRLKGEDDGEGRQALRRTAPHPLATTGGALFDINRSQTRQPGEMVCAKSLLPEREREFGRDKFGWIFFDLG
jgi:hypothetical protein